MLESTRAEEDKIKKETAEGLALFRQQQEEADRKARGDEDVRDEDAAVVVEESWAAGPKKRKRGKEKEGLKGLKVRQASTAEGSEFKVDRGSRAQPGSPRKYKARRKAADDNVSVSSAAKSLRAPKKVEEIAKAPASNTTTKLPEATKKVDDTEKALATSTTKEGLVSYGSDDEDDW